MGNGQVSVAGERTGVVNAARTIRDLERAGGSARDLGISRSQRNAIVRRAGASGQRG